MKTIVNLIIPRVSCLASRADAAFRFFPIALILGLALGAWAAEPSVQLGVVAQRYPWNGTLDVNYRASGLPAEGTNAVLTVTVSGDRPFTQDVTLANGTNTLAFTSLPMDLKAKDAKVTLAIGEKE